jgi:hypothetical protein
LVATAGDSTLSRADGIFGRHSVGGIDLNKPRIHAALSAALALAAAPGGFTVGQLANKVHTTPTTPSAKPPTTCANSAETARRPARPHPPLPPSARRRAYHRRPTRAPRPDHRPDHRRRRSPRQGRKPKTWTAIDRDYEQIRIDMQTLFGHLGLTTATIAA